MSSPIIFLLIVIPCAATATVFAILILVRVGRLGYHRTGWPARDFRLYAVYWREAPKRGWSRWPLIGAAAFFLAVVATFLMSAFWVVQ